MSNLKKSIMPRPKKTDKFFFYTAKKSGFHKNKKLIGVNHFHEESGNNLNLQDLINFVKENDIDPSKVKIHSSFTSYAVD